MLFSCDTIWLLQDFTKDKTQVADAFNREVAIPGGCPAKAPAVTDVKGGLHRAVYEAAKRLNGHSVSISRRYTLALTTDWPYHTRRGCGTDVFPQHPPAKDTQSKDDIYRHVFRLGNTVSAVVLPYDRAAKLKNIMGKIDNNPLNKIDRLFRGYDSYEFADISFYAGKTGGEELFATPNEVTARLIEMIDHLYEHYSIGYRPSNRKRDGKFRRINLKVTPDVEAREKNLVVATREGYYAPLGSKTKGKQESKDFDK